MTLPSGSSGRLVAASIGTATVGASLIYIIRRMLSAKCRSATPLAAAEELSKQEVEQIRRQHFCSAVSVSYSNSSPLMIVGGSGSRLYDSDGRTYLDTRNNVCHVGHQHPAVVGAVQKQVATLNTNTRYLHPNATLLAQRLASLLPDPLEVVFLVNSGSEANDLALRLARAATGSDNTIIVDGAYHGHTLACLEVSPYKYEKSDEFDLVPQIEDLPAEYDNPITPRKYVWKVPCPDTYRGMHRDASDAAERYAEYVEEACRVYTEERGEELGAFMVEGGMSVAGVILPPPSYLKKCVNVVRDAGGLYIADEIQTGFGRLGSSYWAFQHGWDESDPESHVVPDIVTVGKPFGNGMPLAAVVTTREIANAFEDCGVEYFNTFGGNPVCSAAGLAVLDTIESESLQDHAEQVGDYLMSKFRDLMSQLDIIGDVRGSGLFIGVELVRDRKSLEPATAETSFICATLKEKYAVLTSIDGPHDNVLVIKPPMVFSLQDADILIKHFEEAVTTDLASMSDINTLPKTPT